MEGETPTLLFIASGPLYNVAIRIAKFKDSINTGNLYYKPEGTETFQHNELEEYQIDQFRPNISENVLMFAIHNVTEDIEGPYAADLMNPGGRWKSQINILTVGKPGKINTYTS